MVAWPKGIGAITLFVEDLEEPPSGSTKEVFGLPVTFEDDDSAVFNFGDTMINLLKRRPRESSSSRRRSPTPEAGSRLQLTIQVDDVDAMCGGAGRPAAWSY